MRLLSRLAAPFVATGLLFAPGGLAAQRTLSLQGGLSLGSQWAFSEEPQGTSYRVGFRAGVSTVFPQGSTVAVQLGVAYVQGGGTQSPLVGIDHTLKIDYLELPLLLRLSVPSAHPSPYLLVGPAVSLVVACSSIRRGGSTALYYGSDPASLDCDAEGVDSFDFGAMGGVGMDVRLSGQTTLAVEVLYYLGLSSVGVYDKLRMWSVSLGVGI